MPGIITAALHRGAGVDGSVAFHLAHYLFGHVISVVDLST